LDNPATTGGSSYLGYAAEFKELNFSTKIDYALDDTYHVTLIGDYVNNIGYNAVDVNARVGVAMKKETEGFQVGLSVGMPETRAFMDWRVFLNYKYLEADAVVDAFTESDFHLGGTNAKGWITGFDLGLAKNVWLTTRWFTANEITGTPLAIDVFYLNLNVKF
jgi:outer membrane cobalamin receptor